MNVLLPRADIEGLQLIELCRGARANITDSEGNRRYNGRVADGSKINANRVVYKLVWSTIYLDCRRICAIREIVEHDLAAE